MTTNTTNKTEHVRSRSIFTTIWGWFTAPRFGSAGSGGLEYEPFPRWTDEMAVPVKR